MSNPNWYPETYKAVTDPQAPSQEPIFEPALVHFSRAFRLGDPIIEDEAEREQWYAARRQVLAHLLRLIANSPLRDLLVLRGSLLVKEWIGREAREPGDIDWVLRNIGGRPLSIGAIEIVAELRQLFEADPVAGPATIQPSRISMDEIWRYGRTPGHRLQIPWTISDLPPGQIQIDIAFGEKLLQAPELTRITFLPGEDVELWTATPQLSLAWKLAWLICDAHPQGKDLYDATLLAEYIEFPRELTRQAAGEIEGTNYVPIARNHLQGMYVDWENFQLEHPWISDNASEWNARLLRALKIDS
jgi:hypothetical protein